MEKVNVKFHDNDTVTFQHRKILHFVPEMSRSMHERICVPNIPLLVSRSRCGAHRRSALWPPPQPPHKY